MSALLFTLFLFMPDKPTVGPTWTWPDHQRISNCDDDDWNVEEAALERSERCARHEAEEEGLHSFAWAGDD